MDLVFIPAQRANSSKDANCGRREPAEFRSYVDDVQLARARSLRYVRHQVRRAPGFKTHFAARGMERSPATQGLRHLAARQRMGADQLRDRERTINRETND